MVVKNYLLYSLVPYGYTFVGLLLPTVLCFYLDMTINRSNLK